MRIAALLLALLCSACAGQAPQVTIAGETWRGRLLPGEQVREFLGIPFAAPPVGELRWRAPQPYVPAGRTRNATAYASACMQSQRMVEWYRDVAELAGSHWSVVPDLDVSEDCLYLNVWTPDTDARLPVMVYVHGGSNRSGWSFEPNYRGHELAKRGVVVVSIAYRLGEFGFFAHPELDEGPAVANFGLWDQLAALEWIRRHIARFGGDPANVTLFGESAGAEDIVALMFVRRADDLFDRAILQSTANFLLYDVATLAEERERGMQLARRLGNGRPLSIAELRALPAEELLERSMAHADEHYHSPVIDGVLLTASVGDKLRRGDYRKRRVILGTNADEWLADIPAEADGADLDVAAEEYFGGAAAEARAAVAEAPSARKAIERLTTAALMLCPGYFFAEALTTRDGDAWLYWFSAERDGDLGDEWGAYHGTELPYVFGTHDAWMPTSAADRALTDTVVGYWTRFAKNGDPNGGAMPPWPAYRPEAPAVQELGHEVRTITPPDARLCELLAER